MIPMEKTLPFITAILETVLFVSVVFMHLVKKNTTAIWLYIGQSVAVTALFALSSLGKFSILLLLAMGSTIVVKVIIAPYYFFGLIERHRLKFSVSTYLSMPLTLVVIAALTAMAQTDFLKAFSTLSSSSPALLLLAFSAILISIFLIINRKGALSQMLGILSLENGIVSFAVLSGLEQSPSLQLGITFNILIWVMLATVLSSKIFGHFGSLDVTAMKKLTE